MARLLLVVNVQGDPGDAVGQVGANVRRLRGDRTQSRLSLDAGISQGALSRIENGQGTLDLSLVVKLADALGVPVSHLLTGVDEPEPRQPNEKSRLLRAAEAKGMTLADLARVTGYKLSTIRQAAYGARVSPRMRQAFIDALGADPFETEAANA